MTKDQQLELTLTMLKQYLASPKNLLKLGESLQKTVGPWAKAAHTIFDTEERRNTLGTVVASVTKNSTRSGSGAYWRMSSNGLEHRMFVDSIEEAKTRAEELLVREGYVLEDAERTKVLYELTRMGQQEEAKNAGSIQEARCCTAAEAKEHFDRQEPNANGGVLPGHVYACTEPVYVGHIPAQPDMREKRERTPDIRERLPRRSYAVEPLPGGDHKMSDSQEVPKVDDYQEKIERLRRIKEAYATLAALPFRGPTSLDVAEEDEAGVVHLRSADGAGIMMMPRAEWDALLAYQEEARLFAGPNEEAAAKSDELPEYKEER